MQLLLTVSKAEVMVLLLRLGVWLDGVSIMHTSNYRVSCMQPSTLRPSAETMCAVQYVTHSLGSRRNKNAAGGVF